MCWQSGCSENCLLGVLITSCQRSAWQFLIIFKNSFPKQVKWMMLFKCVVLDFVRKLGVSLHEEMAYVHWRVPLQLGINKFHGSEKKWKSSIRATSFLLKSVANLAYSLTGASLVYTWGIILSKLKNWFLFPNSFLTLIHLLHWQWK